MFSFQMAGEHIQVGVAGSAYIPAAVLHAQFDISVALRCGV